MRSKEGKGQGSLFFFFQMRVQLIGRKGGDSVVVETIREESSILF